MKITKEQVNALAAQLAKEKLEAHNGPIDKKLEKFKNSVKLSATEKAHGKIWAKVQAQLSKCDESLQYKEYERMLIQSKVREYTKTLPSYIFNGTVYEEYKIKILIASIDSATAEEIRAKITNEKDR